MVYFSFSLKQLKSIIALSFLLILTGCGEIVVEKTKEASLRTVPILTLEAESFAPTVKIFGTLEPKTETTVAAEVSGNVQEIFVEEGQNVEAGQILVKFSAGDNLLQLSYQNTIDAHSNAKRSLEITKKTAEKDEEDAKISVEKAEITLKNAKLTDEKTGISLQNQIDSAQRGIRIAETNVEIADVTLKNIIENNAKKESNFSQSVENLRNTSRVLFEDIVLFVDETVGITNANDNNRRSYGNYLSFHKQSALVKLENEWRVVNTNLKKLQEKVSRLTSEDWGNLEKLSDLLLETQDFSYELRQLLQLFETVLTNSRVGGGLTDTVLSSLKGENSTYRNSLETNIESLTTESQSITDFLLEAPQDVLDKELAVLSARIALLRLSRSWKNFRLP